MSLFLIGKHRAVPVCDKILHFFAIYLIHLEKCVKELDTPIRWLIWVATNPPAQASDAFTFPYGFGSFIRLVKPEIGVKA